MPDTTRNKNAAALIEGLEPRVLYSADVLAGLAGVDPGDDERRDETNLESVYDALRAADGVPLDGASGADVPGLEIVFVAANVDDLDTLLADFAGTDAEQRRLEVVVLERGGDALGQISAILGQRSDVEAIHLIAHGDAGSVDFGNERLDLTTLAANRELIAGWSDALTDDADFLIYGCDLAASDDGLTLVQSLAALTGADVAASDDLTGSALRGGDWDLEVSTGAIQVSMALSAEAQQQWAGTLATFTVTNLNATGTGSLDWAIGQANFTGGLDMIDFAVAGTITVSTGFQVLDNVIIDATTAPGYIDAPVVEIDGSSAVGVYGFVVEGGATASVIQGLNVHSFDAGLFHIKVSDVTLADNFLGTNLAGTAAGPGGISGDVIFVDTANDVVIRDNVISGGGGAGIHVSGSDRVIIQGNLIGTDATGTASIANVNGIELNIDSKSALIGTDGDTINDAAEANVISGNSADGIRVTGNASNDNVIAGNLIGVNASGTAAIGNGDDGIVITDGGKNNIIGGVGVGNVIAGHGDNGIVYTTVGAGGLIQGNYLGTNAAGTEQWGNLGAAIFVDAGVSVLTIGGLAAGEGNVIAYNGLAGLLGPASSGGVWLAPATADKVAISGNLFYGNYGLDIDLNADGVTPNDPGDGDNGPNKLQNYADLSGATTDGAGNVSVSGDTFDLGGGTFTVLVYASTEHNEQWVGEGARLLFTDTVPDGTTFTLNASGVTLAAGEFVSVVLIDAGGNTSEFSRAVVATDLSGNSTPIDAVVTGTPNGGVSLNEDGSTGGYLYADDGGAIFGGLTAYTIETRFSFTDTATSNALLTYSADQVNEDLRITIGPSGDLIIVTGTSGVTTSGFDFHSLAGSGPHTLSVSWDNAGNLNVYVDGDLKFATTGYAVSTTLAAGGHLIVGQDQNGMNNLVSPSQSFSGTIYDLRVFDTVRSAAEIAANHTDDVPFDTANLVASWSFDSLSVDGVVGDAVSGNNLNVATQTGAAWVAGEPLLEMSVSENATVGAEAGTVAGIDPDREALIAALLQANPNLVYSAETGKFYEALTLGDWGPAEAAASSQLLGGIGGQLVVIDSALENAVVLQALNQAGATAAFIGATDQTSEGAWYWRAGGADDQQFWAGDFTGNSVNELYYNWVPTDPNGAVDDNVDYAIIQTDGLWYDRPDNTTTVAIVEWDADAILDVADNLSFSFAPGGDAGGAFAIDSNTGVVTVLDPNLIDHETAATLSVTVRVTDGMGASVDKVFDIVVHDEGGDASFVLPAPQSGDEDVGIVFSVANGNAVVVDSGGPYDPVMTVTLSVSNGTLTLGSITNVAFMDGTSNGDATITLMGNVSDLNAALDGLSYVPAQDYNGADTLTVSTGSAAANLVGDYGFEDGSLLDSSGAGNDALLVGGNADPDDSNDVERGDALSFDGDDRLDVTGRFGDPTALTISAWVNLDAGQSNNVVASLGDHIFLVLDGGTGVQLWVGNQALGGLVDVAGTGWRHVAASIDNVTGILNIYVDGVLVNTASTYVGAIDWSSATSADSSIGGAIAAAPFINNDMVGDLDDVRVYDRALTTAEVAALAGHQGVASGSVALTVDPINDEETIAVNLTATVNEGSGVIIGATLLDTTDVDNTPAQIVYTVTTGPANGYIEDTGNAGVPITTFTQADIDAGIIRFVHNGNETSSDFFDFTVDDGAGTVSSGRFNFQVDPVNDEETIAVNLTATVNEGSGVIVSATFLETTDSDNTPAQIVYTVTAGPANGFIEDTGNAGMPISTFTQADIDAGIIRFVHNGSETSSDFFDFTVDDSAGTVSSGRFNFQVDAVNDEETIAVNLTATVNEGSGVIIGATLLDTTDVDNTPAQIVYTVTAGPANGYIEDTGNAGVPITTFTQADIDAGIIRFVHNGNETSSDFFDFTVDDGAGTVSSGRFNFQVDPVNDEETIAVNLTATVNEGSGVIIDSTLLDTTDVDNTPAQIVYTVTTGPANGYIEDTGNAGVPITTFTQADIDAGSIRFVHNGTETSSDFFDFTVDDSAGTVSSGRFNFQVDAVNDEETIAVNLTATVNEGSGVIIGATLLDTTDVDNTPAQIVYTVTAGPANGFIEDTGNAGMPISTFTQADIDVGIIRFVHNGSETSSDFFDFTVDDSAGTVSSGRFNFQVDAVNDEETIAVNLTATVNEGSGVIVSATFLETTDSDNTPAQIVYTVTAGPANGFIEDTGNAGMPISTFTQADIDAGIIRFVHNGSETSSDFFDFTVDDSAGTVSSGRFNFQVDPVNDEETIAVNLTATVNEGSGVIIDSTLLDTTDVDNTPAQIVYTVTTGPANGYIEDTGNAGVPISTFTQADIDAGIIRFVHNGTETSSDFFDFTVDDGAGTVSSGRFNFQVDPVNDEEVLSVNLTATVNEGSGVIIDSTLLDTTDVDNTPAQIVYTVTAGPANGFIEDTGNAGMPISTFTQADIDAGIIRFVHNGSETSSDFFDFTVDDGAGTVSSGRFNFQVDPVNDEETIAVNLTATVNEGSGVIIDSTLLDTTDVDNTPAQIVYTVTTGPANGYIEDTGNAGVPITTFTQADIDAGIIRFVHNGNETSSDFFDFTVDDSAGTVSSGRFNFQVDPVNDEETIAVNLTATVNEGSGVIVSATFLETTDSDNTPAQIVYTVTAGPANGFIEDTGNAGMPISTFTQADIDAGIIRFVHNGSETSSDFFDFTVDDSAGTVSSGRFNFQVDAVNDEETIAVNLTATVNEGSGVIIGATLLDTTDTDNTPAQIVYTVTTGPANGYIEDTGNAGVPITTFTQADIDAGIIRFVHNGSETNSDFFGFTVDDGAGAVSGGTFDILVTQANDEQVLTVNLGATVAEGSDVTIDATALATSDTDDTPAQLIYTVTSGPANGHLELTSAPGVPVTAFTQADLDAGSLRFVHDGSETTADSFAFTVDDGAGGGSSATFDIVVNPVNDEQLLNVNLGATVDEGGAIILSDSILAARDVDNLPAQLVFTLTSAPASGYLELTSAPGVSIASFTQADLIAGAVRFVHNGGEFPSDSFDFVLDDGAGAVSPGSFTILVNPVNDAPLNAGGLPATLGVVEDVASPLDLSALIVADLDAGASNLTVTLASATGGQLTAATAPGVITAGSGTGLLTLTGSAADLNAFFASAAGLDYLHGPADIAGNAADTIAISLSDNGNVGAGGPRVVALGSVSIDIAAQNDAPQVFAPAGLSAVEQTALSLHGRGIALADVDAGGGTMSLTLSVAEGALSVTTGTLGIAVDGGNDTAELRLSGSLADLNALLAGSGGAELNFVHASDTPPPSVALRVTVDDNGFSGAAAAQSATTSLDIAIASVDDAPLIVSAGGIPSVAFDAPEGRLVVADVLATDVDTNPANLSFSIVGGADAAQFVIDASGEVRFQNAPIFEFPQDFDNDNIYHVQVEVSDGTSSALQELVVRVQKTAGFADLDAPILPSPLETERETVAEDDDDGAVNADDLAAVMALSPRQEYTAPVDPFVHKLTESEAPAPIQVSAAIIESIVPDNDKTPAVKQTASVDLLRNLLRSGASPAKFAADLTVAQMESQFSNAIFVDGLDNMREALDDLADDERNDTALASSIAVGASASLTVGVIGWVLRAGSLIAGFLSSAPLWRHLDPLAMFAGRKSKDERKEQNTASARREDKSLERMFRRRQGESS